MFTLPLPPIVSGWSLFLWLTPLMKTSVLFPAEAQHSSQVQTSRVLWSSAWCIPWVAKTLQGHAKRICKVMFWRKFLEAWRKWRKLPFLDNVWMFNKKRSLQIYLGLLGTVHGYSYCHITNFSTSTPNFIYCTQYFTTFLFNLSLNMVIMAGREEVGSSVSGQGSTLFLKQG